MGSPVISTKMISTMLSYDAFLSSEDVINYGLSESDVCAELRAVTMDMRGASINVASHLPRGTKESSPTEADNSV